MELRVEQRVLLQMLYRAQGIVDKKSTLNVLAHVLVESVGQDAIRMSCTDYDVGLIAEYPAEILEEGAIAINGKNFFDVVKSLPAEPVTLRSQANHWVEVTCGRSSFKLAGIAPREFPEQKEPEDTVGFSIDRATLLGFIDKTIFSMSTDESRMNLNGAYLLAEPVDGMASRITFVSTDGHRLSKASRELPSPEPVERRMDAIIHRKGVQELRRVIDGDSETVRISSYQNNMVFRYENAVLLVRQIEDSFPEFTKVIPTSPKNIVKIDRQELHDAIRRTATLTSVKVSIIKVILDANRLVITTTNPDYGEAKVDIDVAYEGPRIVVGFNYRYLLDVLNVIEGDEVLFKINDEFSPGLLESDDDPGTTFVIMPMRI